MSTSVNFADLSTITVAHIIRWSSADSEFKPQYDAFCNTYPELAEGTLDDRDTRFALRRFNKRTATVVAIVNKRHVSTVRDQLNRV